MITSRLPSGNSSERSKHTVFISTKWLHKIKSSLRMALNPGLVYSSMIWLSFQFNWVSSRFGVVDSAQERFGTISSLITTCVEPGVFPRRIKHLAHSSILYQQSPPIKLTFKLLEIYFKQNIFGYIH